MARAVGDFDHDGEPEVAVGRIYGESADEDGGLQVLEEDGRSSVIPTLRGVRALAAADVDGDGKQDILFGDGWHKNYGQIARFRPSLARWTGTEWQVELLEEREDQPSVEHIGTADGLLVAAGSRELRRYQHSEDGWQAVGEPIPTSISGSWAVLGKFLITGGPNPRRIPLR
jgi:hypothetical protein